MSDVRRRVSAVEKRLGVGSQKVTEFKVVVRLSYKEGTVPVFSEPLEEWLTYRKAEREFEEQTGSLRIFMFTADPFAEYEAREGLKGGVLSRHENKGQTRMAGP